jgi:signal transduction histidine kinase
MKHMRHVAAEDMVIMVQACETVVASQQPLYVAPDPEGGLTEAGALLPLHVREETLGVLVIIGAEDGALAQSQMPLFKSIADQLSIAIDNARLYERAAEAAVATERNRLARDLHDAVTQTLFSATLVADVLPRLWDKNPAEGRRRLEEVRQLTRGALSEMRTLLLELRPTALIDTDLADLIEHQVNAFIARARLEVHYSEALASDPPPAEKEVFYRIAQEALNNIAKHAGASRVSVTLTGDGDGVNLRIQDDGCGFNPDGVSAEHLGLGIMRERAEGIGARLSIESHPQQGTTIQLIWSAAGAGQP